MEMEDGGGYSIEWVEADTDDLDDLIEETHEDDDDIIEEEYLVGEEIIPTSEINTIPNSLDQIAAENLIYMAQDGNVAVMGDLIEEQVEQAENADYNEHQYFECQVTEEVITDDWVQQQGEERVEIPVERLGGDGQLIEEDIEVPLPTDQDEYTASRPYPCDFCSRRFRKKANLMNHMVAHKNDRPHICNLCGARYIRRVDLLNHLKIHAQVPEQDSDEEDIKPVIRPPKAKKPPKQTKPRAPRKPKQEYNNVAHEDDMHLLIKAAQQHENYALPAAVVEEKYPVIDPHRPFVCQKCGVSFAREKALLSHSRMHGGDSPYECDNCSEMFWDMSLLREHQKIHHGGQSSNSEYEPEQEKDFTDSETEVDTKFGEFYCKVCGMAFHRQDLLKRHSRTHMKMENEYESTESNVTTQHCCNVCGESFIEALDLLAHAEVHARNQPFKCMLCGEIFLEEPAIKKHISSYHEAELTENTCRLCGKHCRDSRSLMKHSWEHSDEKNHSCSKCGKTFHNKARLKRHMQSHRNKSVTCDVCGDEFPDGRSLMNHRHSHTNVSGRHFPCKECSKTFGSRSSQQIHMRIHTGERPYGCRYCWKAFADGGTLRKHERIHTGEKPYACPICPRAFNQRVVLREHIRSHHSTPDSKHSSSTTPYYCTVCGDLFAAAQQLIQHLIEHSDMNTAMKRQPTTGPRKYKRRRKLKPHELERLRSEKEIGEFSDEEQIRNNREDDDDDVDDVDFGYTIQKLDPKPKPKKQIKSEKKSISFNNDSYAVFHNLENALQSYDSLVIPSSHETKKISSIETSTSTKKATRSSKAATESQSRPKMIHTQKMRVAVEDGKRKTRTLIRSTPKDAVEPPITSRKRQRRQVEVKQEDYQSKSLSETDILLELSKKNLKYPDVVNDLEEILRSPIKVREPIDEYITSDIILHDDSGERPLPPPPPPLPQRTSARRQQFRLAQQQQSDQQKTPTKSSIAKKLDIDLSPTNNGPSSYNPLNIKMEQEETFTSDDVFTCEMCSAVFKDRAQLLIHVPIHI